MSSARRRQRSKPSASASSSSDVDNAILEALRRPPINQMTYNKQGGQDIDDANVQSGRDSPFMMFDALSQVASMAFEAEEEEKEKKPIPKKITQRSVQSLSVLNLDQIRQLSEKTLINMFSEMTGDEIKKNYTYTCILMPSRCCASITSFGNESKARFQMKDHLQEHIVNLIKESEAPGGGRIKFTSEPLHARKRRLSGKKPIITRNRNKKEKESPPQPPQLKPKKMKRLREKKPIKKDTDADSEDSSMFTLLKNKPNDSTDEIEAGFGSLSETDKRIAENEQFITDLLNRNQPHHDHCYTTIFGKRRGIEWMHYELDSDSAPEDEEYLQSRTNAKINNPREITTLAPTGQFKLPSKLKVMGPILAGKQNTSGPGERNPVLRMTRIPVTPDGTPIFSNEEVVQAEKTLPDSDTTGERPYPPMPKFELAKKGRMDCLEEDLAIQDLSSDESLSDEQMKKRRKKNPVIGTAEWERRLALKCIRELRLKKRDDTTRAILECKICRDKTFTATATLMYHYRSHAGIKPFMCLICGTTFTRQHSLNYHMLIHNNQSRFTCKECGRKFRHPSHFKEHLRRHTGETPFECTDCPFKFKTRNTYKRHLKTRHGKLLTANGISEMPADEFARVKTKPYRYRQNNYVDVFPNMNDVKYNEKSEHMTQREDKAEVVLNTTQNPSFPEIASTSKPQTYDSVVSIRDALGPPISP